jgi:tetrapyrrole methylase family protein/MazG family protein
LLTVQKLLRKADAIGLDPELAPSEAAGDGADLADDAAIGDALAAIVATGKRHQVDAESALAGWARRFRDRFQRMEALARARDIDLAIASPDAVRALWQEV